jgi:zinc/manganese transport system substrate-binding protein
MKIVVALGASGGTVPAPVRPLVLAAAACALLLGACGTQGDRSSDAAPPAGAGGATVAAPARDPIAVVTSTDVYGDIVSRVGGDRVAVTSIISDASQDPHSYEANPRTQLALSRARLVVANGGGYDDFIDTMLDSAGDADRTVLDAVAVSGRTAPPGGELNEHVWYDLPAMAALAGRIADVLGTVEPAGAAQFRRNADAFRSVLAVLTARERDLRSGHAGAKVAVTEPVPLYLLEACGLRNVTPEEFSEAIEEGTDVPARLLAETVALVESGEVEALVYNEQSTGPQTERLRAAAERNGVPVVRVSETLPDGRSYVDWMGGTLDAVRDALTDGAATGAPTGSPGPAS